VVIDLTRVLSGPYATMLLGDLGATVIKIESPDTGDTTRHSAPFRAGQSHYFLAINRNKHSVAVDLSTEQGRDLVRRLCAGADVLIENFRPGAMAAMGLSIETLQAANPALIACSISGFGQTGPLRDRIAYDVITQAMSGILATNGEPEGEPIRLSIPIGDLSGGLFAVIGIVAALLGRQRGQSARHIDLSLHDGLISQLGYLATLYDFTGRSPERIGRRHHSVVPYGSFRTRDGHLALAIFTTKFWIRFCTAIGRPELARDPRFRSTAERMRNRVALEAIVEDVLGGHDTAHWTGLFEASDVPASPILTVAEALEHRHTQARGMFPAITHPDYGAARVPGPPLRLGGPAIDQPRPPPLLGEDTVAVLKERLGLSEVEIGRLRDAGVIADPRSGRPGSGATPQRGSAPIASAASSGTPAPDIPG
jgi:crotonobetainyl-CoA:carnitine CoA-transferase CaiB-like acyl-CoA transferase